MGQMQYGDGTGSTFAIEDSLLAHLAAVTTAKLRRREPFLLTLSSGVGRESVWIHEASTLAFRYGAVEPIELDRARLESMVQATNRPTGLTVACLERDLAPVGDLVAAA